MEGFRSAPESRVAELEDLLVWIFDRLCDSKVAARDDVRTRILRCLTPSPSTLLELRREPDGNEASVSEAEGSAGWVFHTWPADRPSSTVTGCSGSPPICECGHASIHHGAMNVNGTACLRTPCRCIRFTSADGDVSSPPSPKTHAHSDPPLHT